MDLRASMSREYPSLMCFVTPHPIEPAAAPHAGPRHSEYRVIKGKQDAALTPLDKHGSPCTLGPAPRWSCQQAECQRATGREENCLTGTLLVARGALCNRAPRTLKR